MKKNQLNKEGNREGYWEEYHWNGRIRNKGNFINEFQVGYWEYYSANGQIYLKEFHLK